MQNQKLSVLSLLLVIVMLLGFFAACDTPEETTTETDTTEKTEVTTDNTGEESESETQTTLETEADSETETDQQITLEGNDAELIVKSNELKNGVTSYYSDSSRNDVTIDNTNMTLGYRVKSSTGNMLVSHLSTRDGKSYITDTMDIFIKMKDGKTYYSSQSVKDAYLNIYRYGYYYFENRLEGQVFANDIEVANELVVDHTKIAGKSAIKTPDVKDGVLSFRNLASSKDPWIRYDTTFEASEYDYFEITMKTPDSKTLEMFIIAGSATSFGTGQREVIDLIDDGEFHTYRLPMSIFSDYTKTFKGFRLDVTGDAGALIEISGIRFFKADYKGAPVALSMQRSFLTYSDKLHHLVQFSTEEAITDIESFGMVTEIAADTVEKLVIKDKKGLKESLDGVHWASAEYIGFDIKDVGIFGYIMPYDNASGTFEVTLADGVYTIVQTFVPEKNTLNPSTVGSRNKNDVFFGQRIYTEENHDFDTFLKEAECERNPLTSNHITVDERFDEATFAGYDALRGYYKFTVAGSGFNNSYYQYPNKQFRVKFTVTGDSYDRKMYFCTYTTSGNLESAVLLNDKDMLLPIPIEVAKNFAGDGENTIYNLDDAAYGETYFPMIIKTGETKTYSLINLYQNWGNYPLKQISSIQFFSPYYHLSTGVTETNCIVQLAQAGPGLPDHRAMSAPFWPTQPQHNSGGGHAFLRYNDEEGTYHASENTSATIDSYGPTYCDITLGYETYDGAISATYTHTEMPQTDENRAFYEMKYTFNRDITFEDFYSQFTIYNVTNNDPKGAYKKVGYLDENNECQVVDAVKPGENSIKYVLGTDCPYFSFFYMPDYDVTNKYAFGYTNVSFLVYNYEIISCGEKKDANFAITNSHAITGANHGYVRIGFDIGEIAFKKGDTITINAIIMPWGSQETDYSGAEPDASVREVRRNSLLNPFRATAVKDCEIIDSVFVPRIASTNGKSAEFTLAGGNNNCPLRVYGFDTLCAPVIEELVNGEWVKYEVSSINTPDKYNFAHHYDGYMVYYDGDGTYSYSFVVEMNNGAERTFRVTMDENFEGWPEELPPAAIEKEPDPINVFCDPQEFIDATIGNGKFVNAAKMEEDFPFARIYGAKNMGDAYLNIYSINKAEYKEIETTGKYMILKYRMPKEPHKISYIEFFTSTEAEGATGTNDTFRLSELTQNGEWQVVIVDLAKMLPKSYIADEDGTYKANFLRIDLFDQKLPTSEMYIDVAYLGICDDLSKLLEMNQDVLTATVIEGGSVKQYDTRTGKEYVEPEPVYVDPESGYTMNTVPFASWLDYISGVTLGRGVAFDKDPVKVNYNRETISNSLCVLTGWCIAEGGIEKYVWSVDDGKTWNDVTLYVRKEIENTSDANFFKAVTDISATDYVIQDKAASGANARFQTTGGKGGIAADLSAYVGETVNVCFAAVPKANPKSLCVLIYIKGVEVVEPVTEE